MNKSDLIVKLARHTLTKNDARKFVDIIFNTIVSALISGEKVSIQNLGTFVPKYYKSKKMYDPKRKKYILINPRKRVKFVVAKGLVNKMGTNKK